MPIWVNNDGQTCNAGTPGLIGSGTDFGYNNKGIMFNETTHQVHKQLTTKTEGLWIFWRAALAEQFAGSIPEFFEALKLDNTGTYLNGYMIVDVNTNETGLMEMSDSCFVEYRSTGDSYNVECSKSGTTAYDHEMVTGKYLMGINFPASEQVRKYLGFSFPVGGTVKEVRIILADDAAGGITTWDKEKNKYILNSTEPGWQSIETRGCVIVETGAYGLVALLPIGMSQVSSVNFEEMVKKGNTFKKGDMLGYFLFGGSDFVILFQSNAAFTLTVPRDDDGTYAHRLMGEEFGRITIEVASM